MIAKQQKTTVTYSAPFELIMARLSENWLRYLFSNILTTNDLLRVWDNFLVYGFEFIHKFGLALLSKNEGFFNNSIKQEIKNLSIGVTIDSLIIAGNITKNKLLKRTDKLQIESLIKKALYKPIYMVLKKVDYNIIINENKYIESRMIEIKELKTFLEKIGFGYDQA